MVRQPSAESGAETRHHAGLIVASERAGFADAAALVEYLLGSLDVGSVREPAELPGTIPAGPREPGWQGRWSPRWARSTRGSSHEIGVPVPSAWAELDLTALWPLIARRDTD